MPITKSAEKALRQNEKRRKLNNYRKRKIKNSLKEITLLLEQKKEKEAKEVLAKAYKAIDKAAKSGLLKKNSAARKKSKIAKLVFGKKTNSN